jgi:peptidoglycan/xylan/chitin deacetylase (PgdA/CDA1 family)
MNKTINGFLMLLILSAAVVSAQQTPRFVAVTIDDLPVVALQKDLRTRQEITRKLLKHIADAKVPAIGFVNENKLYKSDKRDEAEIDLLRAWLDGGLDLGNHTFSHLSLNSNPLEKYEAEILRGETITKELLAVKNKPMRYFRHPYLMTGESLKTKRKLNEFLAAHDYTIAPVTFDNDDYMFARVYDVASQRGDENLKTRVGAAYIPYLESKFDYWERQSLKLFGREPKQILLLHANSINAEYFDKVAEMLKKRGYQFVPLEEALKDEVYRQPEEFKGKWGISWLHRWALAKGKNSVLPDEPTVPDFIAKEYEAAQK